ncbi:hypothetical protein PGQ11_002867 [Apiospora arundinis]|uniref:Uncharacterized protein n=1 Tax=Apiospora arundinis TaxID=335852 RepID=A0ABR2J3F2_9PEZI
MRNGSAVQGVGTIAISLGTEGKVENGSVVPASSTQELSVKIHNFFMVKEVPYHSPPQSSSTGMEIDEDLFDTAQTLEMPTGVTSVLNNTSSMFTPGHNNPFMNMGGHPVTLNSSNQAGNANLL